MFVRKDVEELFPRAVEKDEIFDFITGQNGYEIRLNVAFMPTDTNAVTNMISVYLKSNPAFDTNRIINVFVQLSKNKEWAWLLIFYASDFLNYGLYFLPLKHLYDNLLDNKKPLSENNGWICFNFAPRFNNLWDIIVNENRILIEDGYNLPKLE